MTHDKLSVFWFRRDLRLDDNAGLYHALRSGHPILPLFIFDTSILEELDDKADGRVHFIHTAIEKLHTQLVAMGSTMMVLHGKPIDVWKALTLEYHIEAVFTNHDYEPYARKRDEEIGNFLASKKIGFKTYKDQVIFEKDEVIKENGTPYTVWTPYSRRWKGNLNDFYLQSYPSSKYSRAFYKTGPSKFPSLAEIGFEPSDKKFPSATIYKELIEQYEKNKDFPERKGTSRLGVHLRFGTLSIRELARAVKRLSEKFLNELIWRDFYQMILWHFPAVVHHSFKREFDFIKWRNNEDEFTKWCEGKTGFPIVDAGMRELNATGFMHNRVRMIVASFLTKDLLIDWRWGESYFAKKLLDYELASNNGGWQWAAGTGADAVPYFRIFNPAEQMKKFDPELKYIKKWVPEYDELTYPRPIVDHKEARLRALKEYKTGLDRRG